MLTDLNIHPLNTKTDHFLRNFFFIKKRVKQALVFSRFKVGFGAGSGSGSVIHETDPRILIRIHIKMKRIRNTGLKGHIVLYM